MSQVGFTKSPDAGSIEEANESTREGEHFKVLLQEIVPITSIPESRKGCEFIKNWKLQVKENF